MNSRLLGQLASYGMDRDILRYIILPYVEEVDSQHQAYRKDVRYDAQTITKGSSKQ